MKIAFIAPPAVTAEISILGTCVMGLAHSIEESFKTGERYHNAIRRLGTMRKHPVIVDNSVMELGVPMSILELVHAAYIVDADEVVMPDAFTDPEGNLQLLDKGLKELATSPVGKTLNVHLMAVPQGGTIDEWLDNYYEICARYIEGGAQCIHTIGVPRILSPMDNRGLARGRIKVLERLEMVMSPGEIGIHEWHLLGLHPDAGLAELVEISERFPWIRSCDTSLPVRTGLGHACTRPIEWDDITYDSYDSTIWEAVINECTAYRTALAL